MLEKKKLKAELLRVTAARAEMDYLVEQKKEEIKRLEDAMNIQDAAEISITEKLKALEEKKGE